MFEGDFHRAVYDMLNTGGHEYSDFSWSHNAIALGPAPFPYALATFIPLDGYNMYIHGFSITATEPNDYVLYWISNGTGYQFYIHCGSRGTMVQRFVTPINSESPVNYNAGSGGIYMIALNAIGAAKYYQIRLLLGVERV